MTNQDRTYADSADKLHRFKRASAIIRHKLLRDEFDRHPYQRWLKQSANPWRRDSTNEKQSACTEERQISKMMSSSICYYVKLDATHVEMKSIQNQVLRYVMFDSQRSGTTCRKSTRVFPVKSDENIILSTKLFTKAPFEPALVRLTWPFSSIIAVLKLAKMSAPNKQSTTISRNISTP